MEDTKETRGIKLMELSSKILSDITVYMKYARYLKEENRRESWEELVTRNKKMQAD